MQRAIRVSLGQMVLEQLRLAIARAAQNHEFVESLQSLLGQIRPFRQQLTDQVPDTRERDTLEHRAILEAIRERNPSRAQRLIMAHIANAMRAAGLRPPQFDSRKPAGR
jgi:DNA-binding GntR family transcriptional regulator